MAIDFTNLRSILYTSIGGRSETTREGNCPCLDARTRVCILKRGILSCSRKALSLICILRAIYVGAGLSSICHYILRNDLIIKLVIALSHAPLVLPFFSLFCFPHLLLQLVFGPSTRTEKKRGGYFFTLTRQRRRRCI